MCEAIGPDSDTWERWHRARKEHRCCACGESIKPGDRYHVTSGMWDRRFESHKQCARCRRVWEKLQDAPSEYEPIPFALNCGHVYDGDDPEMYELAFALPGDFAREREARASVEAWIDERTPCASSRAASASSYTSSGSPQ